MCRRRWEGGGEEDVDLGVDCMSDFPGAREGDGDRSFGDHDRRTVSEFETTDSEPCRCAPPKYNV